MIDAKVVSDYDIPIVGLLKFFEKMLCHSVIDRVQVPDVKWRKGVSSQEPVREEAHPGVVAGKHDFATLIDELQQKIFFK